LQLLGRRRFCQRDKGEATLNARGSAEAMEKEQEKKRRRATLPEAIVFGLILSLGFNGITVLMRSYLELPPREFTTAGILATKDFLIFSILVILFEHRLNNPNNVRDGLLIGGLFGILTFAMWMFVL